MPRTILIYQFGDLGDTLLTVPAIRAVRGRYPAARIVLVSKAVGREIVQPLGIVDDVIVVDKHVLDRVGSLRHPRAWQEGFRLIRRLRREEADAVLLFHHLVTGWGALKFALLTLASGASQRFGLDNGRGWFLTQRVVDRGLGVRHEAEYMLDVAGLIDARGDLCLEAPISVRDREAALALLPESPPGYFAIHPGTGWYGPGRRWAPVGFARAAEIVAAQTGMAIVLVGTENERSEAAEVAARVGRPIIDLVGKTSIGELGAVLERAACLIANDGGVAHLSAAVGTPVAAIFGPSNDRAWRPLVGRVIATDLPCRPCFYRDFSRGLPGGCATRECLAQISPGSVATVALDLARGRASKTSSDTSVEGIGAIAG